MTEEKFGNFTVTVPCTWVTMPTASAGPFTTSMKKSSGQCGKRRKTSSPELMGKYLEVKFTGCSLKGFAVVVAVFFVALGA